MAYENKGNSGLVRGKSEPSTIGTYTTKGFGHDGVSGSEPVGRMNEVSVAAAITPQVLQENNMSSKKIVKDGVTKKAAGKGTDGQKPF